MSACNRLDLQTLESQPIVPKNLPDRSLLLPFHCFQTGALINCEEQRPSLVCLHYT